MMLKDQRNITIVFLLFFLLFVTLDHFYSKNIHQLKKEKHKTIGHELESSPCGM